MYIPVFTTDEYAMKIYVDESYDYDQKYFLLWALWVKDPLFDNKILTIKRNHFPFPHKIELKYNKAYDPAIFRYAYDIFSMISSQDIIFSSIIVPIKSPYFNKEKFGTSKLQHAIMYTKFLELLLHYFPCNNTSSECYLDNRTISSHDIIIQKLRHRFVDSSNGSFLSSVDFLDSKDTSTQSLQVCDLLLWCTTWMYRLPTNTYKRRLIRYYNDLRSRYPTKFHHWHWLPSKL